MKYIYIDSYINLNQKKFKNLFINYNENEINDLKQHIKFLFEKEKIIKNIENENYQPGIKCYCDF